MQIVLTCVAYLAPHHLEGVSFLIICVSECSLRLLFSLWSLYSYTSVMSSSVSFLTFASAAAAAATLHLNFSCVN